MQRHDRYVAVGDHVDRQFVVTAEQESGGDQLRSLDRVYHDRFAARNHLSVHPSFQDDHQARIGGIPVGDAVFILVFGQGEFAPFTDRFPDLFRRQTSEQRALSQYRIHILHRFKRFSNNA